VVKKVVTSVSWAAASCSEPPASGWRLTYNGGWLVSSRRALAPLAARPAGWQERGLQLER